MKRLLGAVAVIACAASTDAYSAQDLGEHFPGEISANVTLASDYIFRGVSQSSEQPAIQGGFDYGIGINQGLNFYSGIWASNVNYEDSDEASVEIDYYGGLTYDIQNISLDFGGIYYAYPGAGGGLEYDYFEIQGAATYAFGGASITGSLNYSPDYFGTQTDDGFYYQLATEIPLPTPFGLSIDAHLGHLTLDGTPVGSTDDVTDWSIGLNVPFKGFDFRAAYTDTNLESKDSYCGGSSICDARGVFSVSKSF